MKALYAGSFDPPTLGHLDIIQRASSVVDELVVGIGVNSAKKPYLTDTARESVLIQDCAEMGNVQVMTYTGATVAFARTIGVGVLVRGLRSYADLNKERGMAEINRRNGFETLFLLAESQHANLSSSLVRQVLDAGLSLDGLVSAGVAALLRDQH